MRVVPLSLSFTLLLWSVACNPSTSTSGSAVPVANAAFDEDEMQVDVKAGKLQFEIRGLTNESHETSYGSKSYQHTAIIVPVGNSKYSKSDYWLLCSVKRVLGGDPENTRPADEVIGVYIHNGIGRLVVMGGYKTKDERWDPEKIEVRPQLVFVGTPAQGSAAQE